MNEFEKELFEKIESGTKRLHFLHFFSNSVEWKILKRKVRKLEKDIYKYIFPKNNTYKF